MAQARSFYRRPLPPSCVAFSSAAGRALFAEALAAGGAEGFFPLSEVFHTQSEPAFCGLGSLAMVLNALAIDPQRVWKGAWRWFDESLLDCCVPLADVARDGIVLQAMACLARCNGAAVLARRAPPAEDEDTAAADDDAATPPGTGVAAASLREAAFEEFVSDVRAACFAPAPDASPCHIIVSYSRRALGQSGSGHFSPLGAYAPTSRMVLIMDVARFKYAPHWVSLDALWAAMRQRDPATRLPRGYLRLSAARRAGEPPAGALLTLSRRRGACACVPPAADTPPDWLRFLSERDGALRAALAEAADAGDALRSAVRRVLGAAAALPPLGAAIELYGPMCGAAAAARDAMLVDVRGSALFAALAAEAASLRLEQPAASEVVCGLDAEMQCVALALLLWSAPPEVWADAQPPVRAAGQPPGGAAADEIVHLRAQLTALTQPERSCCSSGRCCDNVA